MPHGPSRRIEWTIRHLVIRDTSLQEMIEDPFLSREVLTTEGVEAVDGDDGLLKELVIKDQPIQPGPTIVFCLPCGRVDYL
jgi:hypothetical protein